MSRSRRSRTKPSGSGNGDAPAPGGATDEGTENAAEKGAGVTGTTARGAEKGAKGSATHPSSAGSGVPAPQAGSTASEGTPVKGTTPENSISKPGPAATSAAFGTAHRFADTPDSSPKAASGRTPDGASAKTPDSIPARTPGGGATSAPPAPATAGPAAPQPASTTPAAAMASPDRPTMPTGAGVEVGRDGPAEHADPYLDSAAASGDAPDDAYGAPGHPLRDHHYAEHENEHEHQHEHDERAGFAATALSVLLGVLAVAVLTLWLAPKLAPHLPAGIAQYVTPGQVDLQGRVAEIEARLGDERAAFEEQRSIFETQRSEFEAFRAAREEQATTVTGELERLGEAVAELQAATAEPGAGVAALDERIAAVEQGLTSLRAELASMAEALAAAQNGEGPSTPELAAALAQVQSRVESLASDAAGAGQSLGERIDALTARLDQAETRANDAQAAQAQAEEQTAEARRTAAIRSALADVEADLASGDPYAEAIGTLEELTGSTAPGSLAAPAADGLPSSATLAEGVSEVARKALAAERAEPTGGGVTGRLGGWLRSQVSARPTSETPGESTGAVLSRAEARLAEGEPGAALDEVETLPEGVRAALGEWYESLQARAAAERALAEWRVSLAADG